MTSHPASPETHKQEGTPARKNRILRRAWKRLPFLWKYQLLFWSIYSAGLYPLHFIGLRYIYGWQASIPAMLLVYLIDTALIILMTWAFAWTLESRLFKRLRIPGTVLWICAGSAILLLANTYLKYPITGPLYNFFGESRPVAGLTWREARIAHHSYNFLLYAAWASIFVFTRAAADARRKERGLQEAEAKRREAEILMLRSQLNPHFLFNALNTLLAESGERRTDRLVEGISDYLRYSLSNHSQLFVPLREELRATGRYLEVDAHRLGESLSYRIDATPESLDVPVPGMLLQPLVENAVKYGRPKDGVLHISLDCRFSENRLEITVRNTGGWLAAPPLSARRPSGVGLSNLKGRLELLYPGRSHVETGSDGNWSTVSISIHEPLEAPNGSDHFPADPDKEPKQAIPSRSTSLD